MASLTDLMLSIYVVILLTLAASIISSYAQMYFKTGLSKKLHSVLDILKTLAKRDVIIGLFGYFVSFVMYLVALQNSELSIVVPIFASSFIFVTLLSAYKLKERISMVRIIGILLITFGIVFVAMTV